MRRVQSDKFILDGVLYVLTGDKVNVTKVFCSHKASYKNHTWIEIYELKDNHHKYLKLNKWIGCLGEADAEAISLEQAKDYIGRMDADKYLELWPGKNIIPSQL